MIEKEMELYPEDRRTFLEPYLRLLVALDKPSVRDTIQKEIELVLKNGLKEEADYSILEMLYNFARLPEQAVFFTRLKKQRYPDGKWIVDDAVQNFYNEGSPAKQKEMLTDIIKKTGLDSNWSFLMQTIPFFKIQLLNTYISRTDWPGFTTTIDQVQIASKDELASLYNTAAWQIQETGKNLELAEKFAKIAVSYDKAEWHKPEGVKPAALSAKQWRQRREKNYALYADTYGMVMYKLGNYKKGLSYAKEAAITIFKRQDPEVNATYALLAEKVLPARTYKKELEQFVKDGKGSGDIKEILKRAYKKEKKDAAGFENYITALEQEIYLKIKEELRKSMVKETTPSFGLLDLDGKKVNIADLKGKVVVVDFWATWCGPCKASFPAMQKMVTKYKDDNQVKFIFIDTWEKETNKEKNAAAYIASNKYTFHVLIDNDYEVVEQFKVEGIPAKFVIDKEGFIRFRSAGFDGSPDKLIAELTAMIELAADPAK